jgi:hypothetical protein
VNFELPGSPASQLHRQGLQANCPQPPLHLCLPPISRHGVLGIRSYARHYRTDGQSVYRICPGPTDNGQLYWWKEKERFQWKMMLDLSVENWVGVEGWIE